MTEPTRVVAIVPCNDLAASIAFYELLGFRLATAATLPDYAILADGKGGDLHLTIAPQGWLVPGNSPFGIYIYTDEVEALAARLGPRLLHPPQPKSWGMLEFAVSDPDENLVRVGRRL
jgi:catechol 2,3-dioxygenase-like lactoylglutathione lyase family enzyme